MAHPSLAEAEAWAKAHPELLQRTFERFDQSGRWPTLEELQHDFAIGGRDDVDVAMLAHSIPAVLGSVEQGRLGLRTRGLSYVEAASPLLEVWAQALHISCQRWLSDPQKAWLTRDDVVALAQGDSAMADRVSTILFRERWAFGDARGDANDDWSQQIIDRVLAARYTRDARRLLEARASVEFPAAADSEPESPDRAAPEPAANASRRLRVLVRHPLVVTVIGGLLVLAIWALLSGVFSEGSDGRSGTEDTTAQESGQARPDEKERSEAAPAGAIEEKAGTGGASTFRNPETLSRSGPKVEPGQRVQVECKIYSPEPPSVNPDGYWYLLASAPWNSRFYAPANSFWNGDEPGQHPYTHDTDFRVPDC